MKRRVKLTFPEELIQEPVVYKMALKCNVIPNIRRARITETVGEMVLELEGKGEDIEKGIKFLRKKGVVVEQLEGHVIE